MSRLFTATGRKGNILIRLIVGWIFLSEGSFKFLEPQALGVDRFAKIGIPHPEVMAPFVGGVEIVAGGLLVLGFLTRPAAFALLINISVAIISTKIPILLGHGFMGFSLSKLPEYGFLSMMHEARVDLAMRFGLAFLIREGPGPWSLDWRILSGKDAFS